MDNIIRLESFEGSFSGYQTLVGVTYTSATFTPLEFLGMHVSAYNGGTYETLERDQEFKTYVCTIVRAHVSNAMIFL